MRAVNLLPKETGRRGGTKLAKPVSAIPKPTEPVEKSTSALSLVREG